MLLITHLIIALSSLIMATVSVVSPTKSRILISWSLTLATLASGTWLVVSTHSPLLSSCISGLAYTAVAGGLSAAAAKRLQNAG